MLFDKLLDIKEDIWTYLQKTEKKIIMYGTGNGADKIIDVLVKKGIELYGIFASDDFARGQLFRDFIVKKYSDFTSELDDFIVLVSFATQRDEVLENIYKINNETELYAPDVPVFGNGLFDLDYFNDNIERLKSVYDRLSDELSQKTFVNTIAFKLTARISYLKECETTENEINIMLSKIIKNHNYIDVGAYTGDTVEEYTVQFGKNMKLYAFEPDAKNYKKMLERFISKNIDCSSFNFAAWNTNETLKFYSHSGRAGSTSKGKNDLKYKEIQGVKIDDIIFEKIGFVKIDAEGSDVMAIRGMKRIIKENKPCLKVAAYHKNDDYFVIPETVSSMTNNYKLYMRHLKYVPGWDTDFIFDIKN